MHPELFQIHQITKNIFLSGIFPMERDTEIIGKLNIKYILSCLSRENVSDIHDKILIYNPDVTILYLPYEDDIKENLWKNNNNNVDIIKYCSSTDDYVKLTKKLQIYQNKPMIEIAYNFIDDAIKNNSNVLVHCRAGASRSVSMIIYYLMKKNHISFSDALKIINNIRKLANPNNSFQKQLIEYQNYKDKFSEIHSQKIIRSLS